MSKTKKFRFWFSILLIITGLGWVFHLLLKSLNHPSQLVPGDRWAFLISLTLAIFSLGLNFFVFIGFLEPAIRPWHRLVEMFFTGQILKYLPARIWGIVYQIQASANFYQSSVIIRANLGTMLFLVVGNTLMAMLIIGWRLKFSPLLIGLIALGGISLMGVIFLGGASWILKIPALRLPQKVRNFALELSEIRLSGKRLILMLAVFVVSWVCYLGAWLLLGQSYLRHQEVDMFLLCALYSLAALVGIVSAVTPAGLGVREAVFVVLARPGADADQAAFFALVVRLWLMMAELFLFVLGWIVRLTTRKEKAP